MGPRMNADFMSRHVFVNEYTWALNHARPNDVEGYLGVRVLEFLQEISTNN